MRATKAFPKLNTEQIEQSEFPHLTKPDGSFQKESFTKRKQSSRQRSNAFLGILAGRISSPDLSRTTEDALSLTTIRMPGHEVCASNRVAERTTASPFPQAQSNTNRRMSTAASRPGVHAAGLL